MNYLSYKANKTKPHNLELHIENFAISNLAKEIQTPFYCYSKKQLIDNFNNFLTAFNREKITNYKICYAIKANCNLHLVEILAKMGAGIDAVSAGEVFRAIKAGIVPNKIVFAGVGKTFEEIEFALNCGVEEFSVESVT